MPGVPDIRVVQLSPAALTALIDGTDDEATLLGRGTALLEGLIGYAPGTFEEHMPAIADWYAKNPPKTV